MVKSTPRTLKSTYIVITTDAFGAKSISRKKYKTKILANKHAAKERKIYAGLKAGGYGNKVEVVKI